VGHPRKWPNHRLRPRQRRRLSEVSSPPSVRIHSSKKFQGSSITGRGSSLERARDPPLNLPVGSREPYQADTQRISFTDPPNLFLPGIGGPSLSASLGIGSTSNEGQQSIEGLPISSTNNTTSNNDSTMDRSFMNIPSEFGGRLPLITENRTVSRRAPPAPPTPAPKPQYHTLPLSRPSEEKPMAPSFTGAPPPAAARPPLAPKPPVPLAPAQQSALQGSTARILDPQGTKIAAGHFTTFPLKSQRTTNAQPSAGNPTIDQSQPARVVPTNSDTLDSSTARVGNAPSKPESPYPSMDEEFPLPTSEISKPLIHRNNSARVHFAATPPIAPPTATFTKGSDDTSDGDFDVFRVYDGATEGITDDYGPLDNKGGLAAGLGSPSNTDKPNNRLSVTPLKKRPSFEPPSKFIFLCTCALIIS
jgi:hypothetical protein